MAMGVISTNKNKITLYYNSENSIGQQCYAYVQSSDKKVLGIDVSKTKVTGTQWSEIAEKVGIPIIDLINVEHPDFINEFGKSKVDLEPQDWLKIIDKNPKLFHYPIVIHGEAFHQLKSGSDFKKYLE
ncbi:arsenate reductase family protein [Cellulophaga tyrosinoxydans]|jgi:arsenate reductase-like glutaredoxin family protein|uniref:Arsenate reductase, glutaredoxin family n=1 Tax=Cellulophaga tyrosinoxydans TaxID=504486 RepID=A0A1W1YKI0_9FLAO|nr:hypothetical protein [Cellulophaga tyrosinoxydans]SMC36622.1 Arsenate reductase, glutaredoxin family [Cellulophaga tyrosinoxydans]|tara:strand:- start:886 stop:1269 length:384 start_codon:yes stop_codon:yes gene_type:complete